MDSFYLFLNCNDSEKVHKNNSAHDFIVDLPRTYKLTGEWECGLKELTAVLKFTPQSNCLYLCSDILSDSYVRNRTLPVLRNLEIGTRYNKLRLFTFENPIYISVKSEKLEDVRLYLRDSELQPVTFESNELNCVLHFRKKLVL